MKQQMKTAGVRSLGPSPDFMRLLKGKISSKEYGEKVKQVANLPTIRRDGAAK